MGHTSPRLLIVSTQPDLTSDLVIAAQHQGFEVLELGHNADHVRSASLFHPGVIIFCAGDNPTALDSVWECLSLAPSLEAVPKLGLFTTKHGEDLLWAQGCDQVFPQGQAIALLPNIKGLTRLNQAEKVNAQQIELEIALSSLESAYDATIEGWVMALDLRDQETEQHSLRVASMTAALALHNGFTNEEVKHIYRGALLHDIGKLGIPDSILLKTDRLTPEERLEMQRHPELAYQMLAHVSYLSEAIDIPFAHHEKWDGTGYPRGIAGEDIPIAARMFSVVDVYDALRFDRPYRKGWDEDKVRQYLRDHSGEDFDPEIVDSFITMLECLGPEAMTA